MAPRNLKDALLSPNHHLPGRERTAYEIHYRMPRRIGRAYQASHFTLVRRSPEDWNYDASCKHTISVFEQESLTIFAEISGEYDWKNPDGGKVERRSIRVLIEKCYRSVLSKDTALFVFGAYERVIDLVSRQVVDEAGLSNEIRTQLFNWASKFRTLIASLPSFETPDFAEPHGGHYELLSELGSSRKWIETYHRLGRDEWPYVEGLLGDFRHLRIKKKTTHALPAVNDSLRNFDYFLRWERSPQSWNYTFIESLSSRAHSSESYVAAMRDLLCACAISPSPDNSRSCLK